MAFGALCVIWGVPYFFIRIAVRPHLAAVCVFAAICIGERWIGSAIAGILIAGVPLTIALMSRFAGVHEPLGPRRLFGLVIGFLGVAGLVGLGPVSGVHGWIGAACMLLATLGYAAGPLVIQRHLAQLQPIGPVSASLAIASLALLVPALLTFPSRVPPMMDLGCWARDC